MQSAVYGYGPCSRFGCFELIQFCRTRICSHWTAEPRCSIQLESWHIIYWKS